SDRSFDDRRHRRFGVLLRRRDGRRVTFVVMAAIIVSMIVTAVHVMLVGVGLATIVVMRLGGFVSGKLSVGGMFAVMRMLVVGEGSGLRHLGTPDNVALDTVAAAAAARVAMARAPPARTMLALFLCLAVGAFVGFDQCLPVGDRDLVVVGMNFAEGEETMAVAAVFDEGGLERGLYPRDLGEVDIAA